MLKTILNFSRLYCFTCIIRYFTSKIYFVLLIICTYSLIKTNICQLFGVNKVQINIWSSTKNVVDGEKVSIKCSVEGETKNRTLKISWYFDDVVIENFENKTEIAITNAKVEGKMINCQAQVQSQIQVPNPKSKVQRKGTGTRADTIILQATTPPTTTHNFSHLKCQSSDGKRPSMTFLDLP